MNITGVVLQLLLVSRIIKYAGIRLALLFLPVIALFGYAILAFVTVPFLVFVVPRIYWSLHPDTIINTRGVNEFDSQHTQVLMASLVGFTGLYVWLYKLECRIEALRHQRQEEVL